MPHLIATKGSIINVSSLSGMGGDWNMAAYNAAKAGVTNLTRTLALDHGPDGVRVNAVNPSVTKTAMSSAIQDNDNKTDKFLARCPLGRLATPEDIAAAITFLASDDAAMITGVNLPVDGDVEHLQRSATVLSGAKTSGAGFYIRNSIINIGTLARSCLTMFRPVK